MIKVLKKNIEEMFIYKRGQDPEEIKRNLALQFYYYLIGEANLTSKNITRALRNTLKFDSETRMQVFIALCSEYLEHIKNTERLDNRDDISIKSIISNPGSINNIINQILSNPRMVQRMCEVDLNNIVAEIQKKQKTGSEYLAPIARQAKVSNGIIGTLNAGQKAYDILTYNNGINPIELDINRGLNSKRKNSLYNLENMAGITNIGKKADGEDKDAQEDSILLYEHPENPKFKIAVVADGVGGSRKWRQSKLYSNKNDYGLV